MRTVEFAKRLGVELWPGQIQVLEEWQRSGKPRCVLRLGRRSGKTLLAALLALEDALLEDHVELRAGEHRYVLVVATQEQQARELVRVARELLEAAPDPHLRALVAEALPGEIRFHGGVTLRALPCSSRAGRGYAASTVIFDEAAHFVSETEGYQAFSQVWRALVPSVAQFRKGRVLVLSTPRWASGWFWELCRGVDPAVCAIHRPTWEMNPSLSREALEAEFRADPEAAACEWGAEFLSGVGAFLDPSQILSCQRDEPRLPPQAETTYVAAIDPAFARDAFALGIGHLDDSVLVIDGVWSWNRAGFERTLDEVAEICRRYGVRTVRTDQFSAQAIVEGLARRGLSCQQVAWDAGNKWQAYSDLKAAINTSTIELPKDEALWSELINLEARPLPSGGTRVSARPGAHDDRASVVAALCHELLGRSRGVTLFWEGGGVIGGREFTFVGDKMVFKGTPEWEQLQQFPLPPDIAHWLLVEWLKTGLDDED